MRQINNRQLAFDVSRFFTFIVSCSILFCAVGCPSRTAAPQSEPKESISAHGLVIDENSSPRQVAELFVAAAKNNDRVTLANLVALENAKEDLQHITQGKKDFAKVVERAAKATVSTWLLSLQSYNARTLKVREETINESTATVIIEGENKKGVSVRSTINLIVEHGLWKVLPGIH